MAAIQMKMSTDAVRPGAASRRTAVRVQAKTAGGVESSRVSEVKQYLQTLPGWGRKSGPFEDIFDPAGLSTTATIKDVRRWRESEIVHGRVSMLAAVGFIVGEQLEDFPAFFNFDGHIKGQAIHQFDQVQQGFWEPLLIVIGLSESYRVSVGWAQPTASGFNAVKDEYDLGNLYFDPLNLAPTDPDELWLLKTKELNNGRLAMIAIAGFVLQEVAEPGVEIFEHLFYNVEKEVVEEADVVAREVGLPQVPVPQLPKL